jgi:hypothetical protein
MEHSCCDYAESVYMHQNRVQFLASAFAKKTSFFFWLPSVHSQFNQDFTGGYGGALRSDAGGFLRERSNGIGIRIRWNNLDCEGGLQLG